MDDDTQNHDASPSTTEPEHAAEPETPALDAVVADHGATLASHSSAISMLAHRLDGIAEELDDAGGGIVQELVNFLHRLFPGHNVPGTPTDPAPTV